MKSAVRVDLGKGGRFYSDSRKPLPETGVNMAEGPFIRKTVQIGGRNTWTLLKPCSHHKLGECLPGDTYGKPQVTSD